MTEMIFGTIQQVNVEEGTLGMVIWILSLYIGFLFLYSHEIKTSCNISIEQYARESNIRQLSRDDTVAENATDILITILIRL